MTPFEEWWEHQNIPPTKENSFFKLFIGQAYFAGYNQRSSEVARDLKMLDNILGQHNTEH